MNPKKICFISGDITRSGGTERVATILANELVKINEISFLSITNDSKESFFPISPDIKSYVLYEEHRNLWKNYLHVVGDLHNFFVQHEFDIVIDIDVILDVFVIPALYKSKTKLISWEHFNAHANAGSHVRTFARIFATKFSDAIVTITKEDYRNYKTKYKIKCPIYQVYNPVAINNLEHTYDLDSKTIISAGRLVHQKGFDILLNVAEKIFINPNNSQWQWIILGEGADRVELEKVIKEKNLENRVVLKGNVDKINDFYQQSAFFVLTSRYEGLGMVIVEAQQQLLPVVSFNCPVGPSELIEDTVNGFLVEDFNIQKMADKIQLLIDSNKLRAEYSQAATKNLKEFKIEKIVNQWEEIFSELSEGKNGR